MWPRTMWGFRRMLRRFDPENYRLRSAGRGVERAEARAGAVRA
jgi:hypothetical protein